MSTSLEQCAAAFALLETLARSAFGARAILLDDECTQYILSRDSEVEQRGREWKFAIVRTLLLHEASLREIASSRWSTLRDYQRQGVFYVNAVPQPLVQHGV